MLLAEEASTHLRGSGLRRDGLPTAVLAGVHRSGIDSQLTANGSSPGRPRWPGDLPSPPLKGYGKDFGQITAEQLRVLRPLCCPGRAARVWRITRG